MDTLLTFAVLPFRRFPLAALILKALPCSPLRLLSIMRTDGKIALVEFVAHRKLQGDRMGLNPAEGIAGARPRLPKTYLEDGEGGSTFKTAGLRWPSAVAR